jgi:hypothetical protein
MGAYIIVLYAYICVVVSVLSVPGWQAYRASQTPFFAVLILAWDHTIHTYSFFFN